MSTISRVLGATFLVLAAAAAATAQPSLKAILEQAAGPTATPAEVPAASPEPAVAGPQDELERDTPRSSFAAYLRAAREGDYARAAEYLDLRRLPPTVARMGGEQLARHLKTVLDRTLWIDLESLSASPEGRAKDGLSRSRDLLGRIDTGDGKVELTLQRMPAGELQVWKVSSESVRVVPALYAIFGDGLLGEYLPAFFFEYEFATLQLWQWIALAALAPLSYLVAWAIAWLALRLLERSWRSGGRRVARVIAGPLQLALTVAVFATSSRFLGLSLIARGFLGAIGTTLLIVAFTWVVTRFFDGLGQVVAVRLRRHGNDAALPLVRPGVRTAKIVTGGLAFLAMLASFGYDVTAIVAGLGVGGIAVALAAQKSIENLFGGIALFADEPIRVGDFCRFGQTTGTVEEIGLRSTRVRTLDRTLVTVPNAEFSQLHLENFAVRDRFLYAPKLALRYDTSPDQLRWILIELQKLLRGHPKVNPDPARVRFTKFGAYSLDLEVFAYIDTTDMNEYLAVTEDLNLRTIEVVLASGSAFAFPAQTHFTEEGRGIDLERARAAEQHVRALRERGELPLPHFADEAPAASQISRPQAAHDSGNGPDHAGGPTRRS